MHTLIKYYDQVRNRARRHSPTDLSRVSGLHSNNIAAIQNGTNRNPTIGTLKALDMALDSVEGFEHD